MATITRDQVNKLNNQLPEGWDVDIMKLLQGEKVAKHNVKINDTQHLQAALYFMERYDWKTSITTITIEANISLWTVDENGTGHSFGLGKWYKLDTVPRKQFRKMCECAAMISDEFINEVHENEKKQLNNPIILDAAGAHF